MSSFLHIQNSALLVEADPSFKSVICQDSAIGHFTHLREFGSAEIIKITPKTLLQHYNDGIEVCYIHKGRYEWNIEGKSYWLYPGDCCITFPWQKHGSPKGVLDIGALTWIVVSPKKVSNEKIQLGNWSSIPLKEQQVLLQKIFNKKTPVFNNAKIPNLLDEIHQELSAGQFGFKQIVNANLDRIFLEIARSVEKLALHRQDSKVEELRLLIQSNFSHKWTISGFCKILGVGQTKVNHLLKKETGFTPGQYLMHLRIEEAKKQLATQDKSITEIALDCGFSSLQHFSFAFKSHTGIMPKVFRKDTQ